jgi:cation transport ATPase
MRNGKAIGAIVFARIGEPVGRRCVAALEAKNPKARLIYVSRRPQSEARAVARSVGIEVYHYGLSDAAKVTLIRSLGGTTLWIGDGSDHRAREALAASSVSISVAPLSPGQEDRSDILLPYAGLSGVPEAIGISRAHAKRLARDYRVVYAANLFGVAGAVLTGFSPLQVGLISNVGTGLIYARHARALERAAASAERERSRQRQAPAR